MSGVRESSPNGASLTGSKRLANEVLKLSPNPSWNWKSPVAEMDRIFEGMNKQTRAIKIFEIGKETAIGPRL